MCSCDPHAARALVGSAMTAVLQREIERRMNMPSNQNHQSEVMIYIYCELCAAAEELVDDTQHNESIDYLLSHTLRDLLLLSLGGESESFVHASTYALAHFHVLSVISRKEPTGLLCALLDHRS